MDRDGGLALGMWIWLYVYCHFLVFICASVFIAECVLWKCCWAFVRVGVIVHQQQNAARRRKFIVGPPKKKKRTALPREKSNYTLCLQIRERVQRNTSTKK